MIKVEVCATSANLSVGFDCVGLALNLKNIFYFKQNSCFKYEGFSMEYSNDSNLVRKAYEYTFNNAKKEIIPVIIKGEFNIDIARGLGSSSSLIVAGVMAANFYLGNIYNKEEMLSICTQIEGHPDNVAPAIYGGLVASYLVDNYYKAIPYEINKDLKFIVITPPYKLSTVLSRSVLPEKLSYHDIVNNLSRVINIPKAFKDGNIELLYELFNDKLHEPYRLSLIKQSKDIKEIAKKNRLPFCISGSGSSMLIISKNINIVDELKTFNYNIRVLEVGSGAKISREDEKE